MKRYLVQLHCGQLMLARTPGQRFCNRKCAGYFVTRRPGAKKRNKQISSGLPASGQYRCVLESNDPLWNSASRYITKRGYVLLSVYDRELKISFQRMEHIVVWEKCRGEKVPRGWVIHHRNEEGDDNDPGNLVAMPKGLHKEFHVQLSSLREQFHGLEYMKQRHLLTAEYVRRSTELQELRRGWFATEGLEDAI